MKTPSSRRNPASWLPRAACIALTATTLAFPALSDAQGRGGGRSGDSGRSDSGRSDSGRSDSGRSDSGRSDSGRSGGSDRGSYDRGGSDRGGSDRGGSDRGGGYRDTPSRRNDTPTRRDTPREEYRPPVRRDDTPSRRDDSYRDSYRRDDSSRSDSYRSRRDDTSSGDNSRSRVDAGSRDDNWSRTDRTPRDGSSRTDRTPSRTDDRARTDDRGRTDSGSTPQRDHSANPAPDRRPSDPAGTSGGSLNRSRPGDQTRPEHDYRGEPYNPANRRDGGRDTARDGARDTGRSSGRNPGWTGSRESNRTQPNSRDGRGRDATIRTGRDRGYDIFSRSREGRTYNNGVVLRGGGYIGDRGVRRYFNRDYCYYPYYYPTWNVGLTFYSPYSYYYGVCPPYIYRRHCGYYPPVAVWIDIPIYSGVECEGWARGGDYYLDRDYYTDPSRLPERDLEDAVLDLREGFRFGNINLLANLTDPSTRIAVFLRGKYEYSLEANDYLDMTRDMFASTETLEFDVQRIHRRSPDVWVVSGKQVYLNRDSKRRSVYVSFVMERVHGRWTITQVGTAPDRIEEPRD